MIKLSLRSLVDGVQQETSIQKTLILLTSRLYQASWVWENLTERAG
jgi:hypothetical protein